MAFRSSFPSSTSGGPRRLIRTFIALPVNHSNHAIMRNEEILFSVALYHQESRKKGHASFYRPDSSEISPLLSYTATPTNPSPSSNIQRQNTLKQTRPNPNEMRLRANLVNKTLVYLYIDATPFSSTPSPCLASPWNREWPRLTRQTGHTYAY